MIPKVIHYIWLGGKPLPKIAKKCIESWRKYCPEYEIKRWDESNLDITQYKFAKDAYDMKKFAFASDVLRTAILYNEGGVYLDVDVEIIKPIDKFLDHYCFGGFETSNLLNPGLIWGTEPKNLDLKNILAIYENSTFDINLCKNMTVCEFYTKYYQGLGLKRENANQQINNTYLYNAEYFSPIDVITNKKNITQNTHSIHWYDASWYTPKQKVLSNIKKCVNFATFGLAGKVYTKLKNNRQINAGNNLIV